MGFKNKFDLLTNFSASFDRKKMKFRHMSTEKASDFPSQNISCDTLIFIPKIRQMLYSISLGHFINHIPLISEEG